MSSAVRSTATHQASLWGGGGVVSQVWLRNYHPGWYRKYNYILGGALDGGAQVMIFILSFAVFGASRYTKNHFPKVRFLKEYRDFFFYRCLIKGPLYFSGGGGNPIVGNVDYCNGNGALDVK